MALGTTLANCLVMLKAELGNSMSVTTSDDTALTRLLNNTQRQLAADWDWPHLATRADKTVSVLSTALPTTINFDRPVRVTVLDSDNWIDLAYGIGPDEYNVYDSDETNDPIQRWQFASNGTNFEVWPVPATAQTVRFWGQALIVDMAAEQAATLDDLLIVYTTAAKRLAAIKAPDAAFKQKMAMDRMVQLRRVWPVRATVTSMVPYRRQRKEIKLVAIA